MGSTHNSSFQSTLQSVYEYVNRSLSFIEAKNGSLVVFNTALLLGLLQTSQSSWFFCYLTYCFLFILSCTLLIISLLLALWSFMPRKTSKEKKKKDTTSENNKEDKNDLLQSIYSTEGLSNLGNKAFISFLQKTQPDYEITDADEALITYTMHTARISSRKYNLFRYALYFTCAGVLFSFLSLALYIFN